MTTPPDDLTIRRVETQAEYAACVALQRETWGATFTELVPAAILQVAQKVGGVTAGAFDAEGGLVGFVFGMTGVKDGRLVHWSDMLAVRPEGRDRGLGRRLKEFQRACVREVGVETMYWTYDPLVAKNAHLNLNVLGARAEEYVPDMYGADTGSALHSGLGTDRFVVAWDVADDAAPRRAPDPAVVESSPVVNPLTAAADDAPALGRAPQVASITLPDDDVVRVAIPADIHAVLRHAPDVARAWRLASRRALEWYLGHGYAVAGFTRDAGHAYYVLAADEA